jgi:hypothetical protein
MKNNVIIIGGGSAGMSCALRLKDAGQDFLIITERLGGRILYSETEKVNFGAYFVMKNYRYAKRLVEKDRWINPINVLFHNNESEYFSVFNKRTLRELPELVRFLLIMRRFYRHYEVYKERCLVMPQKEALKQDQYLSNLFCLPAAVFIKENRMQHAADDFISKFSYACTGVSPEQITAFDFLNVCLGMVVPIHQFKFHVKEMEDRLEGHLRYGTVSRVTKVQDNFKVETDTGEIYEAHSVVIATPAAVTKTLLGLEQIRDACQLYAYHVRAKLKDKYTKTKLNLFASDSDIIITAVQEDGSYLIYTRNPDADLYRVCTDFELINMMAWEQAMYVRGNAYLEQQYGDRLYVAGDHNGLGLEPAAISGIYAANRIIEEKN